MLASSPIGEEADAAEAALEAAVQSVEADVARVSQCIVALSDERPLSSLGWFHG